MFRITRRFEISYSHRLWMTVSKEEHTQGGEEQKNNESTPCGGIHRCSRLHGHNGEIEVELSGDIGDDEGWFCDFTELEHHVGGRLREWLDHRTLLFEDDPLVETLRAAGFGDAVVTLPANPTCEMLARMIFEEVTRMGFPATAVRFRETARNIAEFRKECQ